MTARYSDKKVGGEVGSTAAQRISTLVKAVVMVAHFVCLLFVAFVTYTAQPGSSELISARSSALWSVPGVTRPPALHTETITRASV